MEKLKIEIATLNNVEELAILHRQLRNTEKNYDSNLNKIENVKDREAKFQESLSKDKSICYIARLDSKAVGYISGYIIDDSVVYKDIMAELDVIAVDEQYRNRGIGKELMAEFEKWCKDNGVKYIRLSVFGDNENAVSIYRKNGYEDYSVNLRKKLY